MTPIYRNFDRHKFQDDNGTVVNSMPEIAYPNQSTWHIIYRTRTNGIKDLSAIVSWRAAIDHDFSTSTDPMSRSTPDMITTQTDGEGETTISVQNNADNADFLAAVDGQKNGERVVWFELEGYNSDGESVFYDRFPCKAIMSIDPQGATEPPPAQIAVWASKAWAYSMFGPRGIYYTAALDVTATGETNIYTVKILADFIPESVFCMRQSIDGAGVPHSFKIWADAIEIVPDFLSGHDDADYNLDRIRIGDSRYWPAGTIIKVEITNASTYAEHLARFVIKGIVVEAGAQAGITDESPAPVQRPSPDGTIWTLSIDNDGIDTWTPST